MKNTPTDKIISIHQQQKAFFKTGATLDISFRKAMLKKLLGAMEKWEAKLSEALWTDLHKSYEEAYLTEISIVKGEIKGHMRNVGKWARKKRVHTPIKLFPASTHVVKEPLGCSLIVSPWNYPVQLLLNPLVGAISAGCTAVLKPSPYVPNVSTVIEDMIKETFDEQYIAVVQGNREVNAALFEQRWDMIFFTGSPALAKTVMAAAAKNLTPVVLELGGKSPCIVDRSANLKLAARRIVFGKYLNCGQTCVAPDYILCEKSVEQQLLAHLKAELAAQYGVDFRTNPGYGRIVNEKHFDRIIGLIDPEKVVAGGRSDRETLKIEPTILAGVTWEDAVMQQEIFGPLLPVLTYEALDEVIETVNAHDKPLALYVFAEEQAVIRRVTEACSFGGGCVNDTIIHLATSNMGFGGVGESGMGAYHGKTGFDTFSHTKSIVDKKTWLDLPMRYQPYKSFNEKLIRLFLK